MLRFLHLAIETALRLPVSGVSLGGGMPPCCISSNLGIVPPSIALSYFSPLTYIQKAFTDSTPPRQANIKMLQMQGLKE